MNKFKLDLIVEAAVNLRIATLRALQNGIKGYDKDLDAFNIYDDSEFKEIIENKTYVIKVRENNDFRFEYIATIEGLRFRNVTCQLLFDGDESKIENKGEY